MLRLHWGRDDRRGSWEVAGCFPESCSIGSWITSTSGTVESLEGTGGFGAASVDTTASAATASTHMNVRIGWRLVVPLAEGDIVGADESC